MITDWAMYKLVTGDRFSDEADVLVALAHAQQRAEEITEREFDKVERTESVAVQADGLSYPKAYPVVSVSVPASATVSDDAASIRTGQVTWANLLPASVLVAEQPNVLVTYVGGWDAPVGGAGPAPTGLTDAICELASRYLEPADTRTVPAGATSVSSRGQGVAGGRLGGSSSIPGPLLATIRKYRHPMARLP